MPIAYFYDQFFMSFLSGRKLFLFFPICFYMLYPAYKRESRLHERLKQELFDERQ